MRGRFTTAHYVGAGIDPAEYHKQLAKRGEPRFRMSRSELTTFLACPSKWVNGFRADETEATEWGTLMDILLLDPARFKEKVAIKPATYTNDAQETKPWNANSTTCKKWLADNADRLVVSAYDHIEALRAVKRIKDDAILWEFVQCSHRQVMVGGEWTHEDTGIVVPVKILLDLVPYVDHPEFGKCLGDFKTTRNAARGPWKKDSFFRGYHVQAVFYKDLYMAARPKEDRQDFRHVVSENVPPYEPARRWIDAEMEAIGRETYTQALDLYCRCLKSDKWPSYDDDEPKDIIPGWGQVSPEPWQAKEVVTTKYESVTADAASPPEEKIDIVP